MLRVFNCDKCHVKESIPNSPDSVQSPRAGAGLRFAVRSLSEVTDGEITLREGELVCMSPHPPRSGPPSPKERVESEEWRVKLIVPDS